MGILSDLFDLIFGSTREEGSRPQPRREQSPEKSREKPKQTTAAPPPQHPLATSLDWQWEPEGISRKNAAAQRKTQSATDGGQAASHKKGTPNASSPKKGSTSHGIAEVFAADSSAKSEVAQPDMSVAETNLYLLFGTDDVSRSRLTSQLAHIRGRYRGKFFPDVPGERLVETLAEIFFPNGFPAELLVANVSFKEGNPFLAVRPAQISPRMAQVLPPGLSLTVRGFLYDNRSNADNPVLLVTTITETMHSVPRPFERRLVVRVWHTREKIFPAYNRQANCLTTQFVSELPPIGLETKRRLENWLAYLDFRERLAKALTQGLRYVDRAYQPPDQVKFLAVAENKESFHRLEQFLRRRDVSAFSLKVSQDCWEFVLADGGRREHVELAEMVGKAQECIPRKLADCPWPAPYAGWVAWRISEEHQEEFERLRNDYDEERAVEWLIEQFPKEGFLSVSLAGDLALIARQRKAVEELQREGGHAPFLSSYLFDIGKAHVPEKLVDIPDDQWAYQKLNESQKRAVRVMLSARDVALVQGPPGTGKTTVIAEAIYQMVREGRRVLVASQANLAVENALERLPRHPRIRAIGLGLRGTEGHPYGEAEVLKTFYGSVAQECRQKTLDAWSRLERERNQLAQWRDELTVVHKDLTSLANEQRRLREAISELEKKSEQYRQMAREQQRLQREIETIRYTVDWLDRYADGKVPDDLPADAAQQLLHHFVSPVCRTLREEGWVAPPEPPQNASPLIILNAIYQLLHHLAEIPGFLRRVANDLTWLENQSGDQVLPANVQLKLHELKQRRNALAQQLATDASVLSEFQEVARQIKEIEDQHQSPVEETVYERFLADCSFLRSPQLGRSELVSKLRRYASSGIMQFVAERMTSVKNALLHRVREREERRPQETVDVESVELQLRELRSELDQNCASYQQRSERIGFLVRKVAEHFGQPVSDAMAARQLVDTRLRQIDQQWKDTQAFRDDWSPLLRWWIGQLESSQRAIRDKPIFHPHYVRSCNVVGVTCTESPWTLANNGHQYFDTVIVDEVSKATPPELLIPMLRGRTAILVGDHRQLPPLFPESSLSWSEVAVEFARQEQLSGGTQDEPAMQVTEADFNNFRRMVTSMLFKELFEQAPDALRSTLTVQYRMHPHIMEAVNYFYDHQLRCGLDDPDGQNPQSPVEMHRQHRLRLTGPENRIYLNPQNHILWVDTSCDPNGRAFYEEAAGTSKINRLEAAVIARILCDMEQAAQQAGYTPQEPLRVGVVSFYGRQIRQIRETIRRMQRERGLHFRYVRYDVNSVDRYQGRERPVILVSLVRRPRRGLSAAALTAQFQRVNVAFSRAQSLLVICGAVSVFREYPVDLPFMDRAGSRSDYVYRHILGHVQRLGGLRLAGDILSTKDFQAMMVDGGDARQRKG
ncbi:MAG: hypothetical protein KatS3mg110_0516 [Pirellulaceae bacterium]|nr:MAG: hypothetical protein KatS3mg110_0516 [Pirellulaceae bacterium]